MKQNDIKILLKNIIKYHYSFQKQHSISESEVWDWVFERVGFMFSNFKNIKFNVCIDNIGFIEIYFVFLNLVSCIFWYVRLTYFKT